METRAPPIHLSNHERLRHLELSLRDIFLYNADSFFVAPRDPLTLRDKGYSAALSNDTPALKQIAKTLDFHTQKLQYDRLLLSYFGSSQALMDSPHYQVLHHFYRLPDTRPQEQISLVNVLLRCNLGHTLANLLARSSAYSLERNIVEAVLDYLERAFDSIDVKRWRLLFQQPDRTDIPAEIEFIGHLMVEACKLLSGIQIVLKRNSRKNIIDDLVVRFERVFQEAHKLRTFSSILLNQIYFGEADGPPNYTLTHIKHRLPEAIDFIIARANTKKALFQKEVASAFPEICTITGLEWILREVTNSTCTLQTLKEEVTSEVDLFILLWSCPSANTMLWLVSHLLLDINIFFEQQHKDLAIPVKQFLYTIEPNSHRSGLIDTIVWVWLLDSLFHEQPLYNVISNIYEYSSRVEFHRRKEHIRPYIDQVLLFTISSLIAVNMGSQIPKCLQLLMEQGGFAKLPSLFQQQVLINYALQSHFKEGLCLVASVDDPLKREQLIIMITKIAVQQSKFYELITAQHYLIQFGASEHSQESILETLVKYRVDSKVQFVFARHLMHVGDWGLANFVLLRMIQEIQEDRHWLAIYVKELPQIIKGIEHYPPNSAVKIALNWLRLADLKPELIDLGKKLERVMEGTLRDKQRFERIDFISPDFMNEEPFAISEIQGMLRASKVIDYIDRTPLIECDREVPSARAIFMNQPDYALNISTVEGVPDRIEEVEEEAKQEEEQDNNNNNNDAAAETGEVGLMGDAMFGDDEGEY